MTFMTCQSESAVVPSASIPVAGLALAALSAAMLGWPQRSHDLLAGWRLADTELTGVGLRDRHLAGAILLVTRLFLAVDGVSP